MKGTLNWSFFVYFAEISDMLITGSKDTIFSQESGLELKD